MTQSVHLTTQLKTRPFWLKTAVFIQAIYALIEIVDCIFAILMTMGFISNFYPVMLMSEIQMMFDSDPVWLIPLFLFYTSLRAVSAVGLWRNRLWGFWLTIFVTSATLVMAPFLLPITTGEMLLNGILIMILFMGYFGNKPILTEG